MGYDKNKIFEKAKKIAAKPDILLMSDVVTMLPCSMTTFYDMFPATSEESAAIKELLDNNKLAIKQRIRSKLIDSDKAAELIALYKIVGTQEERDYLSMAKVEHSGKVETEPVQIYLPNNGRGDN